MRDRKPDISEDEINYREIVASSGDGVKNGQRIAGCLMFEGVRTYGDLVKRINTNRGSVGIPGLGPLSEGLIIKHLYDKGFRLKP
jgi:hypothetical protein